MMWFLCIIRGINVGGHNKIKMTDLRELMEAMGLKEVETYIQSGNVIFRTAAGKRLGAAWQALRACTQLRGLKIDVLSKEGERVLIWFI